MRNFRNTKAITLIALVVSIVVLLLIAGITISIVVEENGIMKKIPEAVEKNQKASAHERIKIAMVAYDIAKGTGEPVNLADIIRAEDWCREATYNEKSKCTKILTVENQKYTVLEDRTIMNGYFDGIVENANALRNAILEASSDDIIGIIGEIAITGALGNGTAKQIKLVGVDEDSSLNMDSSTSNGVDFIIENLIIKTKGASYVGFKSSNPIKYVNCTIENQYWTFAKQIEFENCTFHQTSSDAYNIWTYSAVNSTFTNCTFHSNGKSVLVYNEGLGVANAVVNFNGCTLIAQSPVAGKAAIEIDSIYQKFEVNIDNCTSIGFDNGSVSGNTLWNHKKGSQATITVDGQVMQ